MSREASGETMMHHSAGGVIFADWSHDGDAYYFGRCSDCSWHDPCDHVDVGFAEHELSDHAAQHLQGTP
jgi:hypothetical protein